MQAACARRRIPSSSPMMRHALFAMFCLAAAIELAQAEPPVLERPNAFETLLHPNCSHCQVESIRRKDELRSEDRVLAWLQVQADGYINDGVIPIRFFLNTYRVLSDGWGVFVHDPEAGYARGFVPDGQPFQFHG